MEETMNPAVEEGKEELLYLVARIAHEAGKEKGMTVSRNFVKVVHELAEGFAGMMQEDCEAFAKHARRSTVQLEDVRLCARKNPDVQAHLDAFAQKHGLKSGVGAAAARKRKKPAGAGEGPAPGLGEEDVGGWGPRAGDLGDEFDVEGGGGGW